MVKTGDVIVGESYEDETGNNAVASSSEFVEEDGQLIKRAKGVGFSGSGDDVYDVTVTFKTVIRVRAGCAEGAISDAEEKMEEALDDGDVSFGSFEYRVKK